MNTKTSKEVVRTGACPELTPVAVIVGYFLSVSFDTVNRRENGRTVPSKLAQRQFEQYCVQNKKQAELL